MSDRGSDEAARRAPGIDSDPRLPLLRYLGLRVLPDEVEGGSICELDLRDDLRNVSGMLQGGVTATLLDVVGGVAASRARQTAAVVTADLSIHYLAPARVGPVRAYGKVLRSGRSSIVVDARVIDVGAEERLCAVATMTLIVLGPEARPAPLVRGR